MKRRIQTLTQLADWEREVVLGQSYECAWPTLHRPFQKCRDFLKKSASETFQIGRDLGKIFSNRLSVKL
jgi:hypothetical protein